MEPTTIAIAAVVLIILIGVGYVALRSPTARGAVGLDDGPPVDRTASDWAAGIQAGGSAIGSVLGGIGSLWGAAGGRSQSGAVK